jgi:hypothetical protein
VTVNLIVDSGFIGTILGKQGAAVTQLQQETGCHVHINPPIPSPLVTPLEQIVKVRSAEAVPREDLGWGQIRDVCVGQIVMVWSTEAVPREYLGWGKWWYMGFGRAGLAWAQQCSVQHGLKPSHSSLLITGLLSPWSRFNTFQHIYLWLHTCRSITPTRCRTTPLLTTGDDRVILAPEL